MRIMFVTNNNRCLLSAAAPLIIAVWLLACGANAAAPSLDLPAVNNICPVAEGGIGVEGEAAATTTTTTTCLVDLALPYERLEFETEEGKEMVAMAEADPDVHAFIALECGKVVAEYYDGGLEKAMADPLHLFSVTKSWSALLFGVLEKEVRYIMKWRYGVPNNQISRKWKSDTTTAFFFLLLPFLSYYFIWKKKTHNRASSRSTRPSGTSGPTNPSGRT